MTLHASSKIENLVASIATYLEAQYTTTPIKHLMSEFADAGLTGAQTEWIEWHLLEAGTQYHRQVGNARKGETQEWILQVDAYCSARGTNRYRSLEIGDAAKDVLKEDTLIDFTDHVGGGAAGGLGKIKVRGPSTVNVWEREKGLDRTTMRFVIDLLAEW